MNKQFLLILMLIVILGAGLRFYNLDQESLWTDEMVTLNHLNSNNLITSVKEAELMPPGYFILLSFWTNHLGVSEFSLRFLSAIFDLLSIILIYFLGKELFGSKVGVFSSLLYATTMLNIVYAQEARPYSLFGCLALLSTLIFVLLYQRNYSTIKEKNSWWWVAYILINAFALYMNYMAIFVLAFQALVLFICNKKIIRSLLKKYYFSVAVVILLFIPGMFILWSQAALRQPILQENLVLRGVPAILSHLGIGFYLFPLVGLFFVALGIYLIFRKKELKISIKYPGLIGTFCLLNNI